MYLSIVGLHSVQRARANGRGGKCGSLQQSMQLYKLLLIVVPEVAHTHTHALLHTLLYYERIMVTSAAIAVFVLCFGVELRVLLVKHGDKSKTTRQIRNSTEMTACTK